MEILKLNPLQQDAILELADLCFDREKFSTALAVDVRLSSEKSSTALAGIGCAQLT
jgi:hypothetical protein